MSNKLSGNLFKEKQNNADEDNKRVKTINIILSIVMAIILWAYVIGEVNPETEKQLNGVPLNVIGEKDLNSKNMVVLTEFDDEITAVVKGKRNSIYNITASNLSAYLDISKCVEGENQVTIRINAPSRVAEAFVREASVSVIVDKLVEEPKDVKIVINGESGDGTEVEIKSISSKSVKVSGPSTYVAMVDSVIGILNIDENKNDYDETISVKAVDENGYQVKDVEPKVSTVNVKAEKTMIKSIAVPVEVTGKDDEKYIYHYPESVDVNLKGNCKEVKEIDSLETSSLKLDGAIEDKTLTLKVSIPEGMTAVDSAGKPLEVKDGNNIEIKIDIKVEEKNPVKEE